MITRDDWDNLTPHDQYVLLVGLMSREATCDDLLASIPGCAKHGACVNHAIQWVRRAQGFQDIRDELWCCQDEIE